MKKYVAERDTAKTAFLAAVIGKFDPQFLEAVYQCYQAVYHSYQHTVGRRGKKLCSEEYIQYYESSIFSKNVPDRYIGNCYDYLGFFQRRFQEVGKRILEDLRRGTPGKHWMKEENQKRVRAWAEELRKVGVPMPEFEERTLNFFLADVTDKMYAMMQRAVTDGERIRTENELNYIWRLKEFASSVGANSRYDLKSHDDWNASWYYFDGYILRFDDPGNIVYGVMAKETFWDVTCAETVGHCGAGVAQLMDNVAKPFLPSCKEAFKKYFQEYPDQAPYTYQKLISIDTSSSSDNLLENEEIQENMNTVSVNWDVFTYIFTGFDDPRDFEAVELGYKYYDQLYSHN